VAVRSKDLSISGIAGSVPAASMEVRIWCVLCFVYAAVAAES
jgi:hypothetical protein